MNNLQQPAPAIGPWDSFLRRAGGVVVDGRLDHFGDPFAERRLAATGSICCDCAETAWIEVRGADAQAFLHAQFSNDVHQLDMNHWQPNAYCNPKGRVIALPGLVRAGEGFRMTVPRTLLDPFLHRLRMYVLRSDIVFTPMPDIVNIGLSGPETARVIGEHWPQLTDGALTAAWSDRVLIRRMAGDRAMLSTTADTARELWEVLSESLHPVGESRWAWLDIRSGWPTIAAALSEQHIPQALNLDHLGVVSFDKGCYPGQEIVARVHYLGRVKQRMKQGRIEAQSDVEPGSAVFAGDRNVGQIVDGRIGPDALIDALAVVPTACADPLRVGATDGPEFVES